MTNTTLSQSVPQLLAVRAKNSLPVPLENRELQLLKQAGELFNAGFFDHALLDIWNTAVHNLRRRVEAFGVDLFVSVVKDESGRKKYVADGDTLSERWANVDELVLIAGATRLGILNPKAGKALEMINWMRNHASPAHDSDYSVEQEDVIAHALILQKNLFESPLPDPGHSVSGIFDPIKSAALDSDQIEMLRDQIRSLRPADLRVAFGFMLDLLGRGVEPSLSNVGALFPEVWERANDDLRKTVGLRYHTLTIDPATDDSADKGARTRLLNFLVAVAGVRYVPDAARALLYRKAAKDLAAAKNTSYGWAAEVNAAKTLKQFGPYVPTIAFEEVYQEILSVWCGNYWGRSGADSLLREFIDVLNADQLRRVVDLFRRNERVRDELFQSKPRLQAVALLKEIREKFTIQTHKAEVDDVIQNLPA